MPLCCPRRRSGSRPSFSLFRKHSDPAEKKEEDEEEEEEERECYDGPVNTHEVRNRERLPRRFRQYKPKRVTSLHRTIQLARCLALCGMLLAKVSIFFGFSLLFYFAAVAACFAVARYGAVYLHRVLPSCLVDNGAPTPEEAAAAADVGFFAFDFAASSLEHEYDAFVESVGFVATGGQIDAIFGGRDVDAETLTLDKIRLYKWAAFADRWPRSAALLERLGGLVVAFVLWLLDMDKPAEKPHIVLDSTPSAAAAAEATRRLHAVSVRWQN